MRLPAIMTGHLALLGVAGHAVLLAAFIPTRWGWWGFPLVVIGLIAMLLVWMFVVMPIIYEHGGGKVVHMNVLHLALVAVIFWLTLAMKQRRQNIR